MYHPPPIRQFLHYPLTSVLALAAAGASVAYWTGKADISPFVLDYAWWPGEPWRLLTSTLPHGDFLHLLFNVYWLWAFGTCLEGRLGTASFAGIVLLFGAGSSAAEYAFLHGGIGLSGIGYGLFGLLWVLSRYDARFTDAVDRQTVGLFVVWFFICIITTVTNILPVANIAHGTGAVLGILLGYGMALRRARSWSIPALAGATLALMLLAGPLREKVNLADDVVGQLVRAAQKAINAGDYATALPLYQEVVKRDPQSPNEWHNLGFVYQELGRGAEAEAAFARAWEVGDKELGPSLARHQLHLALNALKENQLIEAQAFIREAEKYDPVLTQVYLSELEAREAAALEGPPRDQSPPRQ